MSGYATIRFSKKSLFHGALGLLPYTLVLTFDTIYTIEFDTRRHCNAYLHYGDLVMT